MTTSVKRIQELTKRQMYLGSSMVVKLNAINGKWYYTVYAWLDQGKEDNKFVVKMDKYNGQDPEELTSMALKELGVKKIKLGKVVA